MDEIDCKIIEELQLNAKITMKELSEVVHLSAPAVIERVRKLEEKQLIQGYHAHVSLEKMNRSLRAIVLFKSTNCKALADFCHHHPDVLECDRVAGEISYIVKIATNSVESLERFIDDSMQFGVPSTNIILSSYQKKSVEPYDLGLTSN